MPRTGRRLAIGLGVLAGAALAISSCDRGTGGAPPPPDYAAGQRAMWQLAPKDTLVGVVIADVGSVLQRLRALRAVVKTGPATRKYVDQGTAIATAVLGFDPLDGEGWRGLGIDPAGPFGAFVGDDRRFQLVFRAQDRDRATATVKKWIAMTDPSIAAECAPVGALTHCGTAAWALPADPAASLWPHLQQNVGAAQLAMQVLAYGPLDEGPAKAALAEGNGPVKAMHAGWGGLTITPARAILLIGARFDDMARVLPYLQPRAGAPSLLGLAVGSVSAARVTFSPDALWALTKTQTANLRIGAPELAAFNAIAGFDLEKDVVENLTGEIVAAGYRGEPKPGKDGKPRSLLERTGSVLVLGTRDDARTRRLADRLGELSGGAIGTFGEAAAGLGVKLSYRGEDGARKVHFLAADLDADKASFVGVSHFELFVTTTPGGLVFGMTGSALEELRAREGKAPRDFLDRLPLPEERAAFERSPFVGWGSIGEAFATSLRAEVLRNGAAQLSPEVGQVLAETMALAQLVYDAVAAVEVSADRAELFYQLTFL